MNSENFCKGCRPEKNRSDYESDRFFVFGATPKRSIGVILAGKFSGVFDFELGIFVVLVDGFERARNGIVVIAVGDDFESSLRDSVLDDSVGGIVVVPEGFRQIEVMFSPAAPPV